MNKENLNGFAISEELFQWIHDNLPKGKTILELGSGNGTKELTKHWKVFSVENNPDWLNVAKDSNYIHAPLRKYENLEYEWYDVDILKKQLPKDYDLLLIDAPSGKGRFGITEFMELFSNWDVPILIDDTHREEERMVSTKLGHKLKRCVFDYSGFEKSFSVIELD